MSKFWNELVQKLDPYVPGEQPKDKKYVKLNTNENPYPPSPKVVKAIKQAVNEQLRLYPDPNADELRKTAAEHFQLDPEQIFVGNGSDEVLAFSFMSFFSAENPVAFADITYSFYKVYANLCSLSPKIIPLNEDFSLPVKAFCEPNGGVVIPNPNAPTGRGVSLSEVKEILEANKDHVVIIDEAYIDFGGESVIPFINDYPNLLVIRTLSKYSSLAGIRVGYALGQKELIDGLNRVKNSFNSYTIDRLALAGAKAAIDDDAYYQEMAKKIVTTREQTIERLQNIGFTVVPSQSNFIFASHTEVDAEVIFHELRDHGVLVRYFNQPRISNHLRITIGTDEEMDKLIDALKLILKK
ncbi:histidinol-phosphate transaminase [Sporolactobacillus laevolacticus]|uniref:Histidinol-phosphate aminotransferase n=1 Tax=Sporolactobacillus laevolacticus DSM 442 TaxID=1395513 RepID=V6IU32_9BACL|nr:histidinol-phosphate transaminase [Sporolactobacillus laevolacticus]EST10402.1 histidinol-phosphate aminotransferase [Sporolactobacillus laevolacticus DSM 442]